MTHDNTATVDAGDLSEVCQAANAWAALLRRRAGESAVEDALRYTRAADRIDAAASRLRRQSVAA